MSDTYVSILDSVQRYGTAMTLRRRVGTGSTYTDVSLKGVPRAYAPDELMGGLQQGDERVVVSAEEIKAAAWPAPPRDGDLLVYRGRTKTLRGARSIEIAGEVMGYDMWVRG